MLAQLAVQGRAADAQGFGGMADIAVVLGQRAGNGCALERVERHVVDGRHGRHWQRRHGGSGSRSSSGNGGSNSGRPRRKIGEPVLRALPQDHGPLARVAQRAHIARPVVPQQAVERGAGNRARGALVLRLVQPQVVRQQQRDIAGPLAQRRHANDDGIEAEQQVGPEHGRVEQARFIEVGGADDAHVDRFGPVGAQRRDLAPLQGREQLGLRGQRHVADFVEEQRAAARGLEAPGAVGAGIGERPFAVAEQLAFERRFGQRAHVHGQQRAARAARLRVEGARHQLLAHAVLAQHHHVGLRGRHAGDQRRQFAHGGRVAHQFRQRPGGRRGQRGAARQRLIHGRDQARIVPGLGDEIAGAALQRRHGQRHVRIRGHRDHGGRAHLRAQQVEQRQAFGAVDAAGREVQVQQHHVRRAAQQQRRQAGRIAQRGHLAMAAAQQQSGGGGDIGVVVEDQDVGGHVAILAAPQHAVDGLRPAQDARLPRVSAYEQRPQKKFRPCRSIALQRRRHGHRGAAPARQAPGPDRGYRHRRQRGAVCAVGVDAARSARGGRRPAHRPGRARRVRRRRRGARQRRAAAFGHPGRGGIGPGGGSAGHRWRAGETGRPAVSHLQSAAPPGAAGAPVRARGQHFQSVQPARGAGGQRQRSPAPPGRPALRRGASTKTPRPQRAAGRARFYFQRGARGVARPAGAAAAFAGAAGARRRHRSARAQRRRAAAGNRHRRPRFGPETGLGHGGSAGRAGAGRWPPDQLPPAGGRVGRHRQEHRPHRRSRALQAGRQRGRVLPQSHGGGMPRQRQAGRPRVFRRHPRHLPADPGRPLYRRPGVHLRPAARDESGPEPGRAHHAGRTHIRTAAAQRRLHQRQRRRLGVRAGRQRPRRRAPHRARGPPQQRPGRSAGRPGGRRQGDPVQLCGVRKFATAATGALKTAVHSHHHPPRLPLCSNSSASARSTRQEKCTPRRSIASTCTSKRANTSPSPGRRAAASRPCWASWACSTCPRRASTGSKAATSPAGAKRGTGARIQRHPGARAAHARNGHAGQAGGGPPRRAPAVAAVGRPAAAGGDCARAGGRPRRAAGRRTDRQPRFRPRRRRHAPAARDQRRRHDGGHGHPLARPRGAGVAHPEPARRPALAIRNRAAGSGHRLCRVLSAAGVCPLLVQLRPRCAGPRTRVPGQAPAQFHSAAAVDGVHAVCPARGGAAQRPAAGRQRLVAAPGRRAAARTAAPGGRDAGRSGVRTHRRPARRGRRPATGADAARRRGGHAPGGAPAVRQRSGQCAGPHARHQRPDGAGARRAARPPGQQHPAIYPAGWRGQRHVARARAARRAGQLDGHRRPHLRQNRARGASGRAATGAAGCDRPRALGQHRYARDDGDAGTAQDGRYRPGAFERSVLRPQRGRHHGHRPAWRSPPGAGAGRRRRGDPAVRRAHLRQPGRHARGAPPARDRHAARAGRYHRPAAHAVHDRVGAAVHRCRRCRGVAGLVAGAGGVRPAGVAAGGPVDTGQRGAGAGGGRRAGRGGGRVSGLAGARLRCGHGHGGRGAGDPVANPLCGDRAGRLRCGPAAGGRAAARGWHGPGSRRGAARRAGPPARRGGRGRQPLRAGTRRRHRHAGQRGGPAGGRQQRIAYRVQRGRRFLHCLRTGAGSGTPVRAGPGPCRPPAGCAAGIAGRARSAGGAQQRSSARAGLAVRRAGHWPAYRRHPVPHRGHRARYPLGVLARAGAADHVRDGKRQQSADGAPRGPERSGRSGASGSNGGDCRHRRPLCADRAAGAARARNRAAQAARRRPRGHCGAGGTRISAADGRRRAARRAAGAGGGTTLPGAVCRARAAGRLGAAGGAGAGRRDRGAGGGPSCGGCTAHGARRRAARLNAKPGGDRAKKKASGIAAAGWDTGQLAGNDDRALAAHFHALDRVVEANDGRHVLFHVRHQERQCFHGRIGGDIGFDLRADPAGAGAVVVIQGIAHLRILAYHRLGAGAHGGGDEVGHDRGRRCRNDIGQLGNGHQFDVVHQRRIGRQCREFFTGTIGRIARRQRAGAIRQAGRQHHRALAAHGHADDGLVETDQRGGARDGLAGAQRERLDRVDRLAGDRRLQDLALAVGLGAVVQVARVADGHQLGIGQVADQNGTVRDRQGGIGGVIHDVRHAQLCHLARARHDVGHLVVGLRHDHGFRLLVMAAAGGQRCRADDCRSNEFQHRFHDYL
uniref:Uncharacterized protein n=1 Tax=Tanacetum cinerariifolium TaxID=118510 RepID=A0A699GFE7_TANCI|nr:hypothetical protein [Tanacetum cinerariifolium]